MKRIFIIAYHFPPDAAVGAVRPAKFAKYLKSDSLTASRRHGKDNYNKLIAKMISLTSSM
jgi:hypothetical protein